MSRSPVIVSLIGEMLARFRDHRAELRTRRIVAELPPHLRKDIGWPGGVRERRDPPDAWSL